MKRIFITGTDTDAGKTTCATALIHALRKHSRQIVPLKPVAAGAETVVGQLRNADALQLMEACDIAVSINSYVRVNPFCFAPPIAPHIAANQAGVTVNLADLLQHTDVVASSHGDILIIEGAGGWLVPLNDTESLADYAQEAAAEVVLVVGMKLGCLSHALLTAADIERRGLKLAGWIANQPQGTAMSEYNANIATLKQLLRAPCLGEIPYSPKANAGQLADFLNVNSML
ncbi:dethiobiotin synthase [Pseudidiomarina gelatinasegens]|jgi:dethiobiotin synthetase|uniref:dethiobiotin synthase n=1 Tax=Pseudidiomarina gelatinasegens TaxID=2487740 RepID=UPI0030EDA212|tara:strand:- start:935 stop:1624 length:690 start_codon:yes stop_codon:yes gene_type:complete